MSILDQKPKSALKEGFGTKFGIGLIIALSLSLAAFQIKAPYQEQKIVMTDPFESEDEAEVPTTSMAVSEPHHPDRGTVTAVTSVRKSKYSG